MAWPQQLVERDRRRDVLTLLAHQGVQPLPRFDYRAESLLRVELQHGCDPRPQFCDSGRRLPPGRTRSRNPAVRSAAPGTPATQHPAEQERNGCHADLYQVGSGGRIAEAWDRRERPAAVVPDVGRRTIGKSSEGRSEHLLHDDHPGVGSDDDPFGTEHSWKPRRRGPAGRRPPTRRAGGCRARPIVLICACWCSVISSISDRRFPSTYSESRTKPACPSVARSSRRTLALDGCAKLARRLMPSRTAASNDEAMRCRATPAASR